MEKQLNCHPTSSLKTYIPGDFVFTNDKVIRSALKEKLMADYEGNAEARIIEELGIVHGSARVDMAVVNGIIHGYELKSDLDTLDRLPEQMRIYNSVLDQITLVVGKHHLQQAINLIPEWWGVTVAKVIGTGAVSFFDIREAEKNPNQDSAAIASLLWREEALQILEEMNCAKGVRSKTRSVIYNRLSKELDQESLSAKVREYLCLRANWRSDLQCTPNGD